MKNKLIKPKIALISLTDCEGCEFAILDKGQKFFELAQRAEIADFHLIEELPEAEHYDIVFVEGPPVTKENFIRLERLRKKSTWLVALGNCAAEGGMYKIKNYHRDICQAKFVYKDAKGIDDPIVRPISDFVKVDFTIPGCPINAEEFIKCTYELLAGRIPQIPQRPVCYECQIREFPCLLQQGQPCLGPVILGGCGAPCPGGGMICQGCRGPLANPDPDFKKVLENVATRKRIEELLEIYGIKEKLGGVLL
jgi:sulfhydrogenase subunit delta